MYRILIFLMVVAALEQFGMTIRDLSKCRSRMCTKQIEKHSRDVLRIDWKPVSVWPEEAERFR